MSELTCILCKSPILLTDPKEHVIPKSLGGKLKYHLLCEACNHNIGATLYSEIKKDAMVRYSASTLRDRLPKIYQNVEQLQKYSTSSPIGTKLSATRYAKGIDINGGKQSDGSLVLPTKNADRLIQKMISRSKSPHSEIKIGESIWDIPNNQYTRIDDNHVFVRWDQGKFNLDFSENREANSRSMVLMAFEYLALLLGKSINDDGFDYIRKYILDGIEHPNIIVEYYRTKEPKPFHLIYPEFYANKVVVTISLFEYAECKVTFKNLHIQNGIDFVYLEDLLKGESLIANSVIEAKANEWYYAQR